MTKSVILKKTELNHFIEALARSAAVVAPIAKGVKSFAFEEVRDGKTLSLKYIPTILPPKKYFMPQREKIQEFDRKAFRWTPVKENGFEKLVIFGVHTCDLSGIQFLNQVMGEDPKDVNYLARMEKITVIGLECNDYCDSYASCAVMKTHLPSGGYDLFFTELAGSFFVDVATPKGEAIVKGTGLFKDAGEVEKKEFENLRAKKEKIFRQEVKPANENLKGIFARSFRSEVWDDLDRRCVACGNCTNVCPTCYCFDIRDEMDLNLTTGARTRVWDSCQNEEFAKVAGGENFRGKRGARQRHRYMRKFNYPVDRFQRYSCTGCGRCSRTCMAKINLKETIDTLAEALS
ncbi:MAG TPA: 4Fe-4S dicluster domain-containing protein [Candidatus Omnitrophota bacterium]|nr:4Fe-4S dicluster domain-containing protein [Candidatus Omnitrophota bacterium]